MTPSGWYADPTPDAPARQQRYFDGTQWTIHIRDAPRSSGTEITITPLPDGYRRDILQGQALLAVLTVLAAAVGLNESAMEWFVGAPSGGLVTVYGLWRMWQAQQAGERRYHLVDWVAYACMLGLINSIVFYAISIPLTVLLALVGAWN